MLLVHTGVPTSLPATTCLLDRSAFSPFFPISLNVDAYPTPEVRYVQGLVALPCLVQPTVTLLGQE